MKDQGVVLGELKALQDLRGGVRTYFFFGGVDMWNFRRVQSDLLSVGEDGQEIDIILQSMGGYASYAYRLINAFRRKFKTINIIIPSWAKSAATIFAIGATRLVLHDYGELGPIDTQVLKDVETDPEGEWSSAVNVQASLLQIEERSREGMLAMFTRLRSSQDKKKNREILKIGRVKLAEMLLDYSAKLYRPLLEKIDTLELGTMARNLDESRMYAKRILKKTCDKSMKEENIETLIDLLTYECPDHGYVVDYDFLSPYLSNLIKAHEAPFNKEYNNALETLSLHLLKIPDDDDIVGFLDDLIQKFQSQTT